MSADCPVTIESQILKLLQDVGGLDEDDDLARLPALVEGEDEEDAEVVSIVNLPPAMCAPMNYLAGPPSPPPGPTPPSPPDASNAKPIKRLPVPGPKIPLPGLRETRSVSVLVIKNVPWAVDLQEVALEVKKYAQAAGSDLEKPLLAVWEMGMVLAELTKGVKVERGATINVQGHSLVLEPSKNPCMEQPAPSQVLQLKCVMLSPEEDYSPLDPAVKEKYKTVTSDAERRVAAKTAAFIADNVERSWEELLVPEHSFRSTRHDGTTKQRKYGHFSLKLPSLAAAADAKENLDGKVIDVLGLKLVVRIDFSRVNGFSMKAPTEGDMRVRNGDIGAVNAAKGLLETFFPFQLVKPKAAAPVAVPKKKKAAKKQQQQMQLQQQNALHTQQQQEIMMRQIAENNRKQQQAQSPQQLLSVPIPVAQHHLVNQSFLQGVTYALSHPVFSQQLTR